MFGYRRHKFVTTSRYRLNKPRVGGSVAKCLTQFSHSHAQASVEIHKRIPRPQPLADGLAAHELAGIFKQKDQQLEWVFLQLEPRPFSLQLTSLGVGFEHTKAINRSGFCILDHSNHLNIGRKKSENVS